MICGRKPIWIAGGSLLLLVYFLFSLRLRPAHPALLVQRFYENYDGRRAMAILCISNTGRSDLRVDIGEPGMSFEPSRIAPWYKVERKTPQGWNVESAPRHIAARFCLPRGQALTFRVSLPMDGQPRRIVVPWTRVPRSVPVRLPAVQR